MLESRSVNTRIELLEHIAADLKTLVMDHEGRLRWIERVVLYGMGAVGVGSFAMNIFDHLSKHTP